MEKQPVGQLPDLTQSNNDDEIMVITNDEYNQLKKEKISDFITDLQSTNTNNSLTTGSDGKLFVSKTINASDVDGVLSLDNIPQLTTNKLPETGISADNYSYPSSITVNDRGQVVSIVEGSAAEAGAYLDQSQLSNCILSLTEGSITPKSYNNVSFVNHGATDTSGVLSNFSASNFAILAKTMSNATAWTFTIPFTTGADVSGKQTIVAINNKDNCVIIDNGAIALVYNGTELKGDVGLSVNTAYILEFIRTTTGYTVNVKQNETIIDTISVLSTAGFFGGKTVFLGNDQSGNYFKGTINLADSTIDENTNVYSATVVGSPTISSSGVISNLSTSNYLVIPYVPQEEITSLEIEVEFTTDTVGARQSIFAQAVDNFTCPQMIILADGEADYSGKLECLLPTTTGTWSESLLSLNPLQANTTYKAKMTWDKTSQQHTLYLSTNGGDCVNQGSITCSEVSAWTHPMAIGVDTRGSSNMAVPFSGSINGSAFKITVNNVITWQFRKGSWTAYTYNDAQTVEVKGNFQLLMPNGRNADQTLKNVEQTISLDSLILYSPNRMGKTILVTEDNELMARDSYVESYTQPNNPALNSIWYDKTDNKLKQQLSSTTTDFASFVGAKIGKIEDDGTDITSATLDVPLTIAKDIDVVHNTGDETIEGKKDFLDRVQIVQGGNIALRLVDNTDAVLNAPTTNAIRFFNSKISAVPTTASTIGTMLANKITWELNGGGEYARISPYFNSNNNLGIGFELFRKIGSTTYTTALQCGIRPNGQDYMNFPKCNARPTTTSSAGASNVDVIVKNYYSGTSGYVQFGSGLKIQWGQRAGAMTEQAVITLPTKMSTNTYFAVPVMLNERAGSQNNFSITNKTTSSFTILDNNGSELMNATGWFVIGY